VQHRGAAQRYISSRSARNPQHRPAIGAGDAAASARRAVDGPASQPASKQGAQPQRCGRQVASRSSRARGVCGGVRVVVEGPSAGIGRGRVAGPGAVAAAVQSQAICQPEALR